MPLGGHIWNAYGDGLATMPLVGGGLLEDVIYQGISPLGEEGWDEEHQLYAFEILATEFAQTLTRMRPAPMRFLRVSSGRNGRPFDVPSGTRGFGKTDPLG